MVDSNELLRRRAEAEVGGSALSTRLPEEMSPEELRKRLYELEVYQVELELQTEELRSAQLALEAERARYVDLYDHAPVGYCTLDDDGVVLNANRTACAMLGADRKDMIGLPLTRWIVAEDQDEYYHLRRRLHGDVLRQGCELRMRGAEGRTMWVRLQCTPSVHREGPRECRIAINDVSEQRELQAGLAQAERLVSMGVLAGGLAHEINNPLTVVVMGLTELAKELPRIASALKSAPLASRSPEGNDRGDSCATPVDPDRMDVLVEYADGALEAVRRVAAIVAGLGPLARATNTEASMVDVNLAIEKAVVISMNELRFRARVEQDLGRVSPVFASETRLAQVFINLLVNAAQAIDVGSAEDHTVAVRTWTVDEWVWAEVSDTGRGIEQERLAKVFDAFHTTKQGSERGLGLSIVKRIVGEFGGQISVESEPDRGSRFLIKLPVARMDSEGEKPCGEAAGSPKAVSGVRRRILVVDDDRSLGITLKYLLDDHYDVVAVTSGRAAKKLVEEGCAFDVILCDLMMPDVAGTELHTWLSRRDVSLAHNVIFITGGVFTDDVRDYLNDVPNVVLAKPFDREAVLEAVGAHLQQRFEQSM